MTDHLLHPSSPRIARRLRLTALSTWFALSLAACGGGGGDGDAAVTPAPSPAPAPAPAPAPSPAPAPAPAVDATALQGRWSTASGTTAYSAVIVAGAGSAQGWLLASDATRLYRLTVPSGATLAATGRGFTFTAGGTQSAAAASATAVANTTTAPATLALTGLDAGNLTLNRSETLAGTAAQADVVGNWRATAGGGVVVVNWSISATGVITGTASTGCVWSGSLTPHAGAAIYSAGVTETCGTTATTYAGIGTLDAGKARVTVLGTTANDGRALVLAFTRP